MNSIKSFPVFGDLVEIIADTHSTRSAFSMIVQNTNPGGGPPPHTHEKEDEIFTVLDGDFELFDNDHWTPLPVGEHRYSLRGQIHTFRNCGDRMGRILIIATPGGIEEYLEQISTITLPRDMQRLIAISADHGIAFV